MEATFTLKQICRMLVESITLDDKVSKENIVNRILKNNSENKILELTRLGGTPFTKIGDNEYQRYDIYLPQLTKVNKPKKFKGYTYQSD